MDIYMMILPLVVPYVTAGIKLLWKGMFKGLPGWLGPFKAVLAGVIVSAAGRAIGVTLPSDLAGITDDQTMAILTSGLVIGAIGSLIRNQFDSLKKAYTEDTAIGKIVRKIAGSNLIV